ncbi:MAG: response regulator, partial [bacterium]|nr:response regulator [bacterium]
DYYKNQTYGLTEEAEVYRRELERSLKRFADRSNSIELIYPQVRFVDYNGMEVAKVRDGRIRGDRQHVEGAAFFAAVKGGSPEQTYLSATAAERIYAMPVYQASSADRQAVFLGAVVLDFVYPLQDFRHTTVVITRYFVIITALSLGIALILTINRVRRLADPIRQLAEAANRIAAGQRFVRVDNDSQDEIGGLAQSFNKMAASLAQNEAALQRKVVETTALYEVGQEVLSRVDLEPILNLIVERAHSLLQADASQLALRQEGSDSFAIQAFSGKLTEAIVAAPIGPGKGIGGRVIEAGEPVLVDDYLVDYVDSPFFHMVREAGLRSWIGVPLKARNMVIGILYAISYRPNRFRQEDQQLLSALADQGAIAIENARLYEQVRRHTAELETKVEERTRELQETNQKLETASRHKSGFLANMSHELRTPMNAIIGFTRLVMRRSKDVLEPRQYENLEKIRISADHLMRLINDILDLSKIEAGRIEIYPMDFNLQPLIDTCLRTVEPMIDSDRLKLVKAVNDDLPMLYTDEDKLKQILMNLLSNAVKFTEQGFVTVTASQQGSDIAIGVTDTGIGIAEEALERIFEEFSQADSSTTRQYGGTGLGLPISRHLAHLMGGDITLQSSAGVGSTFTITIPLRYGGEHLPADIVSPFEHEGAASVLKHGKVVLVIDDDPHMLYLLQENLSEAGYQVEGVVSGAEGIQRARELEPFAIILDILMPHKDGWQVMHELKADLTTRDIPIIVLSIIDQKDLGYRLGAFDYLLKPFDHDSILSTLARISSRQGRLLVVDDDPLVIELVRQLLEGERYDIEAASDGLAALKMVKEHRPDIILLDLMMPHLDGFGVIEALQQDDRGRTIPVIVLTAKTLSQEEKSLLQQQVLTVIQKGGLERQVLMQELRTSLQTYSAET